MGRRGRVGGPPGKAGATGPGDQSRKCRLAREAVEAQRADHPASALDTWRDGGNLAATRPMELPRPSLKLLLTVLSLLALGGAVLTVLLPGELRSIDRQLLGFPDSDAFAHGARVYVLAGLCALPGLGAALYGLGGTLDRYITRQFLAIFAICLAAFFSIWLLLDLSDKVGDFSGSRHLLVTIVSFYGARTPSILLLLLPYSLLLSLLYALGKLSAHRELIAVIQSGRGVWRTTLPLLLVSVFCTLLGLGLNYHWAPTAEGRQDEILAEALGRPAAKASRVLFRNAEDGRLWMIGAFPQDYEKGAPLLDVEVTTTGRDLAIRSQLSASKARWDRATRHWIFEDAIVRRHQPGGAPESVRAEGPLTIEHWRETPWQLIKPGLSPSCLGIPELSTWLKGDASQRGFADPAPYLTHWHYRWAQPLACLVTVLLAAPLAIHFSRRGAGGGVFLAVVLSALMLLASNVSLAFGEAGHMDPALAAWLPNLVFALLGLYLFRRRISGRPLLRRAAPRTA